ncbi:MAG: cation diffusion facilitator family transporter [Chlamydiota bacterium]
MTDKFPKPIQLPETVEIARKERCAAITHSVKIGTAVRLFIVAVELAGVVWYGSATLLLDALATCVDVISSILLILFIRLADKPPDEDHPFGHGRYEPLAGLHLALFLIVVGISMVAKQSFNLYSDRDHELLASYLWLIPAVAVVLLEIAYRYMRQVAKETRSTALYAEAAHFRVDIITSLVAIIALGFASVYSGSGQVFDHFGAIIISVLMIGLGLNAAKENIQQLMDKKPEDTYFELVTESARRVDGVKDVEKIKIQLFGPDAHVNLDIEVNPQLSVFEAHEITQHVRAEIQKDWPLVRDVIVHVEPYFPDDH